MDDQSLLPDKTTSRKSSGLPMWTLLVSLLVLALIGLASVAAVLYFTRSDKAKLERQIQALESQQARAKLDEQKAADDAKLTLARNRQNEVLAQTRAATNSLARLLQEFTGLSAEAAALKANESGRGVALHPDLVAQARRIYESELAALPSHDEIVNKLEAVRRIEQQLVAAVGTSYEPAAELSVTAQNATLWADQERRKVSQVQALLTGLVRESKVKVTSATLTASSPTLETAIQQLNQAESLLRQRAILERTAAAKTEATETVAKAEVREVLEEARRLVAKQDREELVRKAENKIEDTKAQVTAQQKEIDAQKIVLKQKAADPVVQSTLAPFITPGLWTPDAGMGAFKQIEKKPLSFSDLKAKGALNPSVAGLKALVEIATYVRNDRPKWSDLRKHGEGPGVFAKYPDRVALATERQKLLIELGPVLVEMKLLEP